MRPLPGGIFFPRAVHATTSFADEARSVWRLDLQVTGGSGAVLLSRAVLCEASLNCLASLRVLFGNPSMPTAV